MVDATSTAINRAYMGGDSASAAAQQKQGVHVHVKHAWM